VAVGNDECKSQDTSLAESSPGRLAFGSQISVWYEAAFGKRLGEGNKLLALVPYPKASADMAQPTPTGSGCSAVENY